MRKLVNNTNKIIEPGDVLLTYNYDLRNPGMPSYKSPEFVADSYVANFLELYFAQILRAGTGDALTVIDTSNVSQTIILQEVNAWLNVNSAAGITVNGLVVGTNATAVTINDYKLGTLIAHGATSGKLQYGTHTFTAPATDATSSSFTIARTLTNASGGTITIAEIGLYAYHIDNYYLIVRDVLASTSDVLNGGQITFTYTIKATI